MIDNVKDSGSNYKFFEGAPKAMPPRSMFDESYINSLTLKQGEIVPVYTQMTYMNEDWRYDIEAVCRVVNPPVVPLMSRQRMFFHSYWVSFHQIWKNSHIFFDKGRTSSQKATSDDMLIPTLTLSSWSRGSLADFLGFNVVGSNSSYTFPALKFMAYLRIVRDYYINQRIYSAWLEKQTDNKFLLINAFMFPLDDADFRIGSPQWNALVQNQDAVDYLFGAPWYRDFADDYFTRSQLSPVYSDSMPELPGISGVGSFTNKEDFPLSGDGNTKTLSTFTPSGYSSERIGLYYFDHGAPFMEKLPANVLNNSFGITVDKISGITIDKFRAAEAATLILEKMAKTDGSYGEFAKAMFGETPKSAFDFKPTYLGGTYQEIIFSQVLNTTSENQGALSGIGISTGNGSICNFHSDDYGFIITLCSIMPDTYYTTGLNREDTYQTAEDFYLPERQQLGMQAVLGKEIYNDARGSGNNSVFGYQNRYDEMRYRANEVHGKVADLNNESFSPYIQTRHFTNRPTLTPSFLTTKNNISTHWLTDETEVPYIIQVANKVHAIRPLSYRAQPATFGM